MSHSIKTATEIDCVVGNNVRLRRTVAGLSQAQLAQHLGLTFQQIQKYEKGTNRISAGKLHQIAEVLDVPVSFFFEDISVPGSGSNLRLMSRANLETIRDLTEMPAAQAKRLRAIVKSVAALHAREGAV